MNDIELFQGKKCVSCGQFFEANPKVGARQKSCGALECRKKRKRMQERVWKNQNPDYFQGFYAAYVKPWRQKHPEYQKQLRCKRRGEIKTQIPAETPMKSIRLHLRCKWRLGEIKTQFLRVTQTAQGLWVDGVDMQAA